jgi:hypothetical protein
MAFSFTASFPYQGGQLGLQSRELDLAGQQQAQQGWYQRQQADIARGQLAVDQMFRAGQISNDQRQLALAELTQQQQYGLSQVQMMQDAALSRERMQSEQTMAAMQAFGRAYAPNVRAIRSWA